MAYGENKKLKILILSNTNPYKTAGIVVMDLYRGLKEIGGNEVRLLVNAYGKHPDKNVISLQTSYLHKKNWVIREIRRILIRLNLAKCRLKTTNRDYAVQDYDQTATYYSTEKILRKADIIPDVIIVLFMQIFLSFKNLFELNKETKAPILLYMMDMAPMTGGCHYAWHCKGYTEKCGNCPALFSNTEFDQTRKNWLFKNEFVNKTNIIPIAGTEWQYRQLQQSSLYLKKSKFKILLPIDDELFKPGNKMEARSHFNIPKNKKIIFFGALSVSNKRKGFVQLMDALNLLKTELGEDKAQDIHLAIAGKMNLDLETWLPFNYTSLGYLSHQELARAFQAADIFVCPSIEDAGPMMINQSIMRGTPVISFEMGVALDLVITGQTGYRAKLKDSEDLANGIKYILDLSGQKYKEMCENCRELGLELCHPQKQAEKLKEICNKNIG